MNAWLPLDSSFCERLLITFGHFLWQGTLLAMVTLVAVSLLRRRSSSARYNVALAGLLAMTVCPIVTFGLVEVEPASETVNASLPAAHVVLGETEHSSEELAGGEPSDTEVISAPFYVTGSPDDASAAGTPNQPNAIPANLNGDVVPDSIELADTPAMAMTAIEQAWQRYAPGAVVVYLIGVCLFLSRFGMGVLGTARLRRNCTPLSDFMLLEVVNQKALALGLGAVPKVLTSAQVTVPSVIGVLRPVILLPLSFCSNLSTDQVEAIVTHELAHIRRFDHLINAIQRIIEALLFFHPGIWLVSHRVRLERENCCDDCVLAFGADPLSYASSLIDIAEQGRASQLATTVALQAGQHGSVLRRRVHRLLGIAALEKLSLTRGGFALVLGLASIAVYGALIFSAQAETTTSDNDDAVEAFPDEAAYQATLKDGTTVELVGVSTHNTKDSAEQWWRPDGSPMESDPYTNIGGTVYPDDREIAREFAVRIANIPGGNHVDTVWHVDPASGGSTGGDLATDDSGQQMPDTYGFATGIPKNTKNCTLQIAIATGEWQTILTHHGRSSSSSSYQHYAFSFAKLVHEDDGTRLIFSHNVADEALRVVAIDGDGVAHKPGRTHRGNAGDVRQFEAYFLKLPPEEIEEYRIQTRAFQTVQFRNISLHPDETSEVRVSVIELETEQSPTELSDGGDGKTGPEAADSQRELKFVRVVVEEDGVILDGTKTTLKELPTLLKRIRNRGQVVLEYAAASGQLSLEKVDPIFGRIIQLSGELGFAYPSYVGIQTTEAEDVASEGRAAERRPSDDTAETSETNPTYRFGPVVERTLKIDWAKNSVVFPLSTGDVFEVPGNPYATWRREWAAAHGPVVQCFLFEDEPYVALRNVYAARSETAEDWENVSADEIVQQYREGGFAALPFELNTIVDLDSQKMPVTFHLANLGTLQITSYDKERGEIALRYKLIRGQAKFSEPAPITPAPQPLTESERFVTGRWIGGGIHPFAMELNGDRKLTRWNYDGSIQTGRWQVNSDHEVVLTITTKDQRTPQEPATRLPIAEISQRQIKLKMKFESNGRSYEVVTPFVRLPADQPTPRFGYRGDVLDETSLNLSKSDKQIVGTWGRGSFLAYWAETFLPDGTYYFSSNLGEIRIGRWKRNGDQLSVTARPGFKTEGILKGPVPHLTEDGSANSMTRTVAWIRGDSIAYSYPMVKTNNPYSTGTVVYQRTTPDGADANAARQEVDADESAAAVPDAGDDDTPPDEVTIHVSKEGTILVENAEISLTDLETYLSEIRKANPQIRLVVRMAPGVEQSAAKDLAITVRAAGINRLWYGNSVDETELREVTLEESLEQRIAQRKNPALRRQAVAEMLSKLTDDSHGGKIEALRSLQKVSDVPFDRSQFLKPVRESIDHESSQVRAFAAAVLPLVGGTPDDVPRVARLVTDEDAFVRMAVASSLYGLDPNGERAEVGIAIEKLLNDQSEQVQHATVKSLWSHPVTDTAEERLIELSRQSDQLGYDAVYYALSTRPVVSKRVAERLIELLEDRRLGRDGRASWGLSHHKASDEAREIVVDALVSEIDETLDAYRRNQCIWGLGYHGGDAAIAKLKEIAADTTESQAIRAEARTSLRRLGLPDR